MKCPVCSRNAEGPKCPCGADLHFYAQMHYLPDILYNEALLFIKRQEWQSAAQSLAAAWTLRPHDAGVLKLWAHALQQTGDIEGALDKAGLALEITPSDKALEAWFEELAQVCGDKMYRLSNKMANGIAEYIREATLQSVKQIVAERR